MLAGRICACSVGRVRHVEHNKSVSETALRDNVICVDPFTTRRIVTKVLWGAQRPMHRSLSHLPLPPTDAPYANATLCALLARRRRYQRLERCRPWPWLCGPSSEISPHARAALRHNSAAQISTRRIRCRRQRRSKPRQHRPGKQGGLATRRRARGRPQGPSQVRVRR